MTNFETMTAKEIRNMARDAGVKNWWNMRRDDLIAALTIEEPTDNDEVLNVESITVNFATGEYTLKMICEGVTITPRKARKMLRKVFGAKHARWTFNADEVANIKKIIAA